MQIDQKALEELIERVKAATGPDREIDGAIAAALKLGDNLPDWAKKWAGEWKPTIQGSVVLMHGDRTPGPHFSAPSFTASIDAIVALIEAKLPDSEWGKDHKGRITIWDVAPAKVYRILSSPEALRTDCLTLCLAFLQALSVDLS